jgi:FkbM family methyltransferase
MTETYKGFTVRPGTLDDYVVNEISSYRHMPIHKGDYVLDVGGNIGTFARTAFDAGASVVSIEPDPENYALLQKNAPGVLALNAAVGKVAGKLTLYQNVGKNKGLHSTVPTRGRTQIEVPAYSWDGLLKKFKPNKIKIDCEGAEYTFLVPAELPHFVTHVILEYNLSRRTEQAEAQRTHDEFLAAGWECHKRPRFGTKAWATLAYYTRQDE